MIKFVQRFVVAAFLTIVLTSCNVAHDALGPTEQIDSSKLPEDMFGKFSSKRDDSIIMVLYLLSSNLEKTKFDPPEMLRGIAYFEYLLNEIVQDNGISISPKKSMKMVAFTFREALGIPISAKPSDAINMFWSTAKFLEISSFGKSDLSEIESEIQSNFSKVKSSITGAIVQAKLNLVIEQNTKLIEIYGSEFLSYRDEPSKTIEQNPSNGIRNISFGGEEKSSPEMSAENGEDLARNLSEISSEFENQADFFKGIKSTYAGDLYVAAHKIFQIISEKNEEGWETIKELQDLSDFLTIASTRFPSTLNIVQKSDSVVEKELRDLTSHEIGFVKLFLSKFKTAKLERLVAFQNRIIRPISQVTPAVFYVNKYEIGVQGLIDDANLIPIEKINLISKLLKQSVGRLGSVSSDVQSISRKIQEATNDINSVTSELGYAAGQYLASIGVDLQSVADSISQAIQSGISGDLDSLAEGLGYASFADAVAAYNAQYGTNYTEAEARDALGE